MPVVNTSICASPRDGLRFGRSLRYFQMSFGLDMQSEITFSNAGEIRASDQATQRTASNRAICFRYPTFALRHFRHCPSGVVTSVPAGGLNSNIDSEIGGRVW